MVTGNFLSASTPADEMIENVCSWPRLCENAAAATRRKVGAGAGFYFGVRDLRTNQARIASIRD